MKVLTVLKTAGQIADVVLVVHTVTVGLVRLLATEATVTSTAALVKGSPNPKNYSPAAYYDTHYPGREAWGKTIQQAETSLNEIGGSALTRSTKVSLADIGGATVNRYELAYQQRMKGFFDEVSSFLRTHPNASFKEKLAVLDRANLRWGSPR